ncbi:MAG: hypothetical protein IH811_01090 [Proteobacteria bacterium]|nr:hypothetical protein [Pseudomonadota bacterium]
MRFFRNGCVTDFCSCKIGILYILYISSVLKSSCILYTLRFSARRFLALIAMEGMYAGFAGAKACQKKSELIEAPFNLSRKQIGVYDLFPKQFWLELSNV